MSWWLMVAVAMGGNWQGVPSDVVVTRRVPAAPEVFHASVADLEVWRRTLPADCAQDWELGPRTTGQGARARLRYTIGPLKRRLVAQIVNDEPGRLLRVDHEGDKKGFFTQVTYVATEAGTEVTLASYLNPPPWPFKPSFYNKVLPAWTDCYERWMSALVREVGP